MLPSKFNFDLLLSGQICSRYNNVSTLFCFFVFRFFVYFIHIKEIHLSILIAINQATDVDEWQIIVKNGTKIAHLSFMHTFLINVIKGNRVSGITQLNLRHIKWCNTHIL